MIPSATEALDLLCVLPRCEFKDAFPSLNAMRALEKHYEASFCETAVGARVAFMLFEFQFMRAYIYIYIYIYIY